MNTQHRTIHSALQCLVGTVAKHISLLFAAGEFPESPLRSTLPHPSFVTVRYISSKPLRVVYCTSHHFRACKLVDRFTTQCCPQQEKQQIRYSVSLLCRTPRFCHTYNRQTKPESND